MARWSRTALLALGLSPVSGCATVPVFEASWDLIDAGTPGSDGGPAPAAMVVLLANKSTAPVPVYRVALNTAGSDPPLRDDPQGTLLPVGGMLVLETPRPPACASGPVIIPVRVLVSTRARQRRPWRVDIAHPLPNTLAYDWLPGAASCTRVPEASGE